jgi:folate-dependent phosphoribosylglycinamide formyltransferase PurN
MDMEKEPIRLGIFISGGGSTMEAIVKATKPGGILHEKIIPAVVIASKPDIRGIALAEGLGVKAITVQRKLFPKGPVGTEAFGQEIISILVQHRAHWVSQNGWLPLTPENVISRFEGKIFNQHPGETSSFGGQGLYGMRVHAAVLEFQRLSGRVFPTQATIHRVAPAYDEGAIVARELVPVQPGDTPQSLADRVLPVEHELQIGFWGLAAEGIIAELHQESNMIYPSEEQFLQDAIVYAREEYPHG